MNDVAVVIAAGSAGGAALALATPCSSARRLHRCVRPPRGEDGTDPSSAETAPGARRTVVRAVVSAVIGLGLAVLVPGPVGLVAAAVAAFGAHRLLARATAGAPLPIDELPLLCDLLAACLRSGATVPDALRWASAAASDQWRHRLGEVASALLLGAAPREAWSLAGRAPPVQRLADAAVRSAHSGAALADTCAALATELRDAAFAEGQARARRVGVLMAGPLALCFLPAFALLGVVPFVAGLLRAVLP